MDERMGIEGRERERMLIKIMSFGRDVEGGKGYLYKDGQTVGGETDDDGFFFLLPFLSFLLREARYERLCERGRVLKRLLGICSVCLASQGGLDSKLQSAKGRRMYCSGQIAPVLRNR